MEHRWKERTPLRVAAVIYQYGLPILTCHTRDLCVDGLYLETGPARFARNEFLEIELRTGDGRLDGCRIPGLVVHTRHDGIGLLLRPADTHTRTRLRTLWGEARGNGAAERRLLQRVG